MRWSTNKLVYIVGASVAILLLLVHWSLHSEHHLKVESFALTGLRQRKVPKNERCSAFLSELHRSYVPIQMDFLQSKKGSALVYKCHTQCGGLGDRFKGIITVFLLAVLTNRAFLIEHPTPANLADFQDFSNSTISWNYDAKLVEGMDDDSSWEWTVDHYKSQQERYMTDDFKHTITSKVHYMMTNLPIQQYLTWNPYLEDELRKYHFDQVNYLDLPGCAMKFLFQPTLRLQQAVDQVMKDIFEKYHVIGIHIRTGGDGQWIDDHRVPKSEVDYFWNCARKIEREQNLGKPVKWFVASDSEEILKQTESMFGDKVFHASGSVIHVDRSGASGDIGSEGLLRTLVDIMILSECHDLIVSRSNLADIAALRGFSRAFVYPGECEYSKQSSDFTRWWHEEKKKY
jgi:hypothetical protein